MGEGDFADLSKVAVVSPSAHFSFVRPSNYPLLSEDLYYHKFLEDNLRERERDPSFPGEPGRDAANVVVIIVVISIGIYNHIYWNNVVRIYWNMSYMLKYIIIFNIY